MITCIACKHPKSTDQFPVRKDRSGRLRPYCKSCSKDIGRARYRVHREGRPFKHRCTRAKSRAAHLKVPFNLSPEYLESIWTGVCPVIGCSINLNTDRSDEFAAELDRFDPRLGYVQGNVHFISRRANRLKNNVTVVELQQLIDWMMKVAANDNAS